MTTNAERLAIIETSLHKNIRAANEKAKTPLSTEDITFIVRQVLATLSGDISSADLKLYAELEELADYIRHAKEEIASIKPKDISTECIPHATDQLDAVVGATEEATNKIMDVCDAITSLAESCDPELREKFVGCTTRIFEACNFQDITGQRITKVVQTMKYIDGKISVLLTALGDEIRQGDGDDKAQKVKAPPTEADLLSGPQLPKDAIDQAAIDKLLSGE